MPEASRRDLAMATKTDLKDQDTYSNIYQDVYQDIYQDVLVVGADGGNQENSFQEPKNETVGKAKKEVRAGIFAQGQSGCCHRTRKLVTRFWPLLATLLLMWLILLAVILAKYRELSNKMMAAKLDHSAVIANISSSLHDAEINHTETKTRMEKDLEELRARVEAFSTCPQGWKKHESRCYLFSPTEKNWQDARSECRAQNADLVIVNTQQEQNFLAQNLNSHLHWIGLTDRAAEGTWLWVSNEPLKLKLWRQGEPNNSGLSGKEDCAIIEPRNTWNDVSCSDNCRWICEKGLF